MSYAKTFTSEVKEEAMKAAQAFVDKCDTREQASIWGCFQKPNGDWTVTVKYYGLD